MSSLETACSGFPIQPSLPKTDALKSAKGPRGVSRADTRRERWGGDFWAQLLRAGPGKSPQLRALAAQGDEFVTPGAPGPDPAPSSPGAAGPGRRPAGAAQAVGAPAARSRSRSRSRSWAPAPSVPPARGLLAPPSGPGPQRSAGLQIPACLAVPAARGACREPGKRRTAGPCLGRHGGGPYVSAPQSVRRRRSRWGFLSALRRCRAAATVGAFVLAGGGLRRSGPGAAVSPAGRQRGAAGPAAPGGGAVGLKTYHSDLAEG